MRRGHGPAEVISLDVLGAEFANDFELGDRLDPFGDYNSAKVVGDPDDSFDDRSVMRILDHSANERPVDLDDVGGHHP